MWLACAYWVFKDARRRIDDKILIAVAALTGLVFGPIGLIVYAIVRPPEYLDDVRERELEVRMMEQRLSEEQRCSFCKTPVRDDYLVCPTCGRRLRTVCRSCRRPVEPQWRLCPYCEAEVHGAPVDGRARASLRHVETETVRAARGGSRAPRITRRSSSGTHLHHGQAQRGRARSRR